MIVACEVVCSPRISRAELHQPKQYTNCSSHHHTNPLLSNTVHEAHRIYKTVCVSKRDSSKDTPTNDQPSVGGSNLWFGDLNPRLW